MSTPHDTNPEPDPLIRPELDAYRAETQAFRAEISAYRAEVSAWHTQSEARFDRLDHDIQQIAEAVFDIQRRLDNGNGPT